MQVIKDSAVVAAATAACVNMLYVIDSITEEKSSWDTCYKRRTQFAEAGGYPVLLSCLFSSNAPLRSTALRTLEAAIGGTYKDSSTRKHYLSQTMQLSPRSKQLLNELAASPGETECTRLRVWRLMTMAGL